MVKHHFCLVVVSLLSRGCWFPKLPLRQSDAFMLITFSCEPSLCANYYLKPKWQSCQPISVLQFLKILFGSQVLFILRMRCRELLDCRKVLYNSPTCVRESSSHTLGLHGHLLKMATSEEESAPLRIMRRKVFSQHPGSRWSWSGELDALCFSARPRTFSSSYISLPKPEPSALVSCDIRWWVLGQPIPLWSSFSRIPSVSWMQQNTSLSPTRRKTDGKLGHVHYSWRGWLETHNIYHMRPVLRVPVLVLVCQHARWRRRWSGVSLGHRSGCLEQYPAATKRPWTMQTKTMCPLRLISSTLIMDAERTIFHLIIRRGARPSFDMFIFNRCPCSPWVRLLLSRVGLFRCRLVTPQ